MHSPRAISELEPIASGPARRHRAAAEKVFDDLAWLAAQVCRAPIALISVAGERGQRVKAKVGSGAQHAARELPICQKILDRTRPAHRSRHPASRRPFPASAGFGYAAHSIRSRRAPDRLRRRRCGHIARDGPCAAGTQPGTRLRARSPRAPTRQPARTPPGGGTEPGLKFSSRYPPPLRNPPCGPAQNGTEDQDQENSIRNQGNQESRKRLQSGRYFRS